MTFKKLCPIVIRILAGGVSNLIMQERCQACYPSWVECNSLNIGSVNLGDSVYATPMQDVRFCVEKILAHGKIPEVEVFEVGMLNTACAGSGVQLCQTRPVCLCAWSFRRNACNGCSAESHD